jgi:hypothetical protein
MFETFTRVFAGLAALIFGAATVVLFTFGLMVTYNDGLRLFMSLMVAISAVLSAIYATRGKHQLLWIASVTITLGLFPYEAWQKKQDQIEFCQEDVLSECVLESTGKITCPAGSEYNLTVSSPCEELLNK